MTLSMWCVRFRRPFKPVNGSLLYFEQVRGCSGRVCVWGGWGGGCHCRTPRLASRGPCVLGKQSPASLFLCGICVPSRRPAGPCQLLAAAGTVRVAGVRLGRVQQWCGPDRHVADPQRVALWIPALMVRPLRSPVTPHYPTVNVSGMVGSDAARTTFALLSSTGYVPRPCAWGSVGSSRPPPPQ